MKKLLIAWLSTWLLVCVVKGRNSIQAAEKYPVKPISFIVPLEAGSGRDVGMREFCRRLGTGGV
jgi:tripartite-type tricarboxylate transporter receptor subunit TctC